MTDRPTVAMVHYHLRRGGVTRVLEQALEAYDPEGGRSAVLSGEPGEGFRYPERLGVVPALGYDPSMAVTDGKDVARDMRREAARLLGRPPDLWHIHNHALGKNAALPAAAAALAEAGEAVYLQIHDFAEDGRPGNYRALQHAFGDRLPSVLYPLGPRVRYGLLNARDAGFLARAGCPEPLIRRIPNAVAASHACSAKPCPDQPGGRFFLYPTRSIRRKNIGEVLFWAALLREDRFGLSLAPDNPAARPVYERWVALSRELDLPVEFEMGRREPYGRLLERADGLLTTSVAEGFGLAFLETWLAGRQIAGRNLPEITRDFTGAGLDLDGLYDRLDVPVAWVGQDAFRRRVQGAMTRTWHAYGRPLPEGAVAAAVAGAVRGDTVDFGRLDEGLQETALRRLLEEGGWPDEPPGARLKPAGSGPRAIEHNRDVVRAVYGLASYGETLRRQYGDLVDAEESDRGRLDPGRVLDQFLQPERFTLICTS